MISTHPRLMQFSGGPYDGAAEYLTPVVDESGKARLSHLTDVALHHYESDVPLDLLGPCEALTMLHDPTSIILRAARGCQS
jgi:hypothetical protein